MLLGQESTALECATDPGVPSLSSEVPGPSKKRREPPASGFSSRVSYIFSK